MLFTYIIFLVVKWKPCNLATIFCVAQFRTVARDKIVRSSLRVSLCTLYTVSGPKYLRRNSSVNLTPDTLVLKCQTLNALKASDLQPSNVDNVFHRIFACELFIGPYNIQQSLHWLVEMKVFRVCSYNCDISLSSTNYPAHSVQILLSHSHEIIPTTKKWNSIVIEMRSL